MFAKIWTSLPILLAVSLEVHGHAAIAPALGLGSTAPVRNDVKRPSTASPCGAGVNVASALGKSTPVQAAADGTFTATITNFNGGRDGSRQVTAQVDAAATGKGANFVAMTVSTNGDAAPATTGSQPIVASIPAGTTCSGGTSGDLCLVSFKTLGGFGNCVAVQQAGGAASNSTDTATGTAGNSTATGTAAGSASNSTSTAGTATGNTGVTGAAAGAAGTTTKHTGKGNGKVNKGNVAQANGNANAGAAGGGQGAAGTTHKGNGKAAGAGAGAGAGAVAGDAAATGGQSNVQGNQNLAKGRLAQGGTRAARALLADLEERGGEIVNNVRRGIASWAWA